MEPYLNNSENVTGGALYAPSSRLEASPSAEPIPLRKLPKEGYYFHENELIDIYAPIIGPFAALIYGALCRKSYGDPIVEYSLRELARLTGMSLAAAGRCIQILEAVGLIKRQASSGNMKSKCALLSVKALAHSQGARSERRAGPLNLPTAIVDGLKARLKAVRRLQQGVPRAILTVRSEVAPPTQSGRHHFFSVSQRDATVTHEKRQRSTKETQTTPHLLLEERRTQETPTPTPTPNDNAGMEGEKNLPDEGGPENPLKWASDRFNGAIDSLREVLLNTDTPPAPHLANGYTDWRQFGFDHLAIDSAARHGSEVKLVLSAPDPATSQEGLRKYQRSWQRSLHKWFGCVVHCELIAAPQK